jgi:3-oxoadipate enol-lactonase
MRSGDARTKPVVLVVSGIGLTAGVASRSIASLQAHFQVLAAPSPEGSMDGKAHRLAVPSVDGALALLDGAGAEEAHVVGLSFGAVIAQQLALRHPQRVRSLVLCSSSAGGQFYVPPAAAVRDFIDRVSRLPGEEGLWASVPYLYATATWRDHAPSIGEDIAQRLRVPLHPDAYRVQHAVARDHDAGARVAGITARTLVVHGERDRVLPVENGRLLARAIPGARLITLPGGAHALPTDVPDANRQIVKFLRANSRPPAAPPPAAAARARSRTSRAARA